MLKDAENDGEYDTETLEKLRTQVKEAADKHQASLPAATKLCQHDKKIGDIKWFLQQCQKQLGHAQEQREWWSQQIQAKTDRQEVLTTELGKAEEAKKEFMTQEGISNVYLEHPRKLAILPHLAILGLPLYWSIFFLQ